MDKSCGTVADGWGSQGEDKGMEVVWINALGEDEWADIPVPQSDVASNRSGEGRETRTNGIGGGLQETGGWGTQMEFGPSEMEQFRMFQKWLRDQGNRKFEGGKVEKQGVVLDEKYFRRVDKFDGDPDKYRAWIFEVVVALAQVDGGLS